MYMSQEGVMISVDPVGVLRETREKANEAWQTYGDPVCARLEHRCDGMIKRVANIIFPHRVQFIECKNRIREIRLLISKAEKEADAQRELADKSLKILKDTLEFEEGMKVSALFWREQNEGIVPRVKRQVHTNLTSVSKGVRGKVVAIRAKIVAIWNRIKQVAHGVFNKLFGPSKEVFEEKQESFCKRTARKIKEYIEVLLNKLLPYRKEAQEAKLELKEHKKKLKEAQKLSEGYLKDRLDNEKLIAEAKKRIEEHAQEAEAWKDQWLGATAPIDLDP